jgi:hypothetical protein
LLVVSYFSSPTWAAYLDQVGTWKERLGYGFSAISTIVFGGLLPYVYLLVSRRLPSGTWKGELAFLLVFWAWRGVEVDAFYRLQAVLFGQEASAPVVLLKVAVDQFVYNVFWVVPVQTCLLLWKQHGFTWTTWREHTSPPLILERSASVLLSTWVIWLPAMGLIYSLPSPLQLPLCNLVVCFWSLILSHVSHAPGSTDATSATGHE